MNHQFIQSTVIRQRSYAFLRRFFSLGSVAALLLLATVLVPESRTNAQSVPRSAQPLEPDIPIERTLNGGEMHSYNVGVAAEQYARVSVMPQVGLLNVKVYLPNGEKVIEVTGENGTPEGAVISFVGELSGAFRLDITPSDQGITGVTYRALIKELRPATATDRLLVAAEKHFADAELLSESGKPEDLRVALEKYKEARGLWKTANDKRGEADALSRLGDAYHKLSNNREALKTYELALPLSIEAHATRIQADILNNTGRVYYSQGDYQKALDYFYEVLPLFRAIFHQRGEAITLANIAAAQRLLGQIEESLVSRQLLLKVFLDQKDRREEARTHHGIALAQFELDRYDEALASYSKALAIWQELKDRRQIATTLSNQARVQRLHGDWKLALQMHLEVLSIYISLGDYRLEGFTYNYIGEDYEAKGTDEDLAQALAYRNCALAISERIEDKNLEAFTRFGLAKLEQRMGDTKQALRQVREALNIFESLRANLAKPDQRASYLASKREYYELYLDLLTELNQKQESPDYGAAALQISERARARALLDILSEIKADLRKDVDPALLSRESQLQRQLEENTSKRTDLLMRKNGLGSTEIDNLEETRKRLEEEYIRVLSLIRRANPQSPPSNNMQPLDLAEIQQRMLDPDTILLEYFLGEKRSYLFAVTTSTMQTFLLPPRKEIEAEASKVIDWFAGKFEDSDEFAVKVRSIDRFAKECLPAAGRLSRILLGQVAPSLGRKKLLIVSDGILHYFPFALLPTLGTGDQDRNDGKGGKRGDNRLAGYTPLVINHEIVGLPSVSTLDLIRQLTAYRDPPTKMVAAFADPVFAVNDDRVKPEKQVLDESTIALRSRKLIESRVRQAANRVRAGGAEDLFLRLEKTREEALNIGRLVMPSQRKIALDFSTNKHDLKNADFTSYRFVHFATHSFFVDSQPDLSGIVLSLVDRQGKEQDGFLGLAEIYNLKLPVDLVVLSACKTGFGKRVEGEGILGMTRGLIHAGAKRTAVSLWEISDSAGTAELMVEFYRQMLPGKLSPAAALRAAQISLWRQERWKSPYYWAGFVLQGEPL